MGASIERGASSKARFSARLGFSAAFGDALRALHSDAGARELLQRHAAEITLIACDDAGILADIDTPSDLPTDTARI